MFLRSSVVKKGGKTYRYWKLVENVRTDTGPRQQVVAHLGDLSNFTAADWQSLAGRMGEPEMAAALQRRVRQGGRQGRPPKRGPSRIARPLPPMPRMWFPSGCRKPVGVSR
jgi:hypothetical protein